MRIVRFVFCIAALVAPVALTAQRAAPQGQAPATETTGKDLVNASITAMGGEERLKSLHSLTLVSIGHSLALEQSERPEGPWLTTYQQQTEIRDFDHRRIRLDTQRRNWVSADWSVMQTSIASETATGVNFSGRWVPSGPLKFDVGIALDPERLLLTVRDAPDLRVLPDEVEQRIAQHVVGFTFRGRKMRLSLNPWTHLPTMLEQISNLPPWGPIWGDTTERRWFTFWTLEKGGLMYPRQVSTEINGQPSSDVTIQTLRVDTPVDDSQFTIPDDIAAASAKVVNAPPRPAPAIDESRVIAVSDTVAEIPGGFNVSLVHQPDGIVVIEGTTTSAYSQLVMAYVAKRFPGVPIKALVTTSDSWPHIGGIREYVATGTPIYALDLNVPILTRLVTAPHTIEPDRLQKMPKAAAFKPVTTVTTIGSGETKIELVPIRGEIGERMMLAWLPAQHLLYTSDTIQHANGGKGFFVPSMLLDVARAVDREHITGIERVFGMHLTPTAWSEVTAAIADAK
jgi:hypothetical protein